MIEQKIYTTYSFKDKSNNELIHQVTFLNRDNKFDCLKKTLMELTEKFCLSENEIMIERN